MNLCTLDVSKAFDRVNLYALVVKLIDRKLPKSFINIILSWYSNSYILVKWQNTLSDIVRLSCGVRQGGVLSPILFALLVDDMLLKLNNSGYGCCFNGLPIAAFMYADDIIILTSSLTNLQYLINMCQSSLMLIDLRINPSKSFWLRIGKRFNVHCADILGNNVPLLRVEEVKYLGSIIIAASKFSISLSSNKLKFFKNANKIFSKVGTSNMPILMMLTESFCISALLYNLEIFDLNKAYKQFKFCTF